MKYGKSKKLPSGSWRVQANKVIDGELVRKSFTASDKKKAEQMAINWQAEVSEQPKDIDITLSTAIDRFLEVKSYQLKPSTKVAYEKYKRNYFKNLMSVKIDKISKNDINQEINKMLKNHAAKTVKSATAFFVSVIYYFTGNRLNVEMPKKQKTIYNTPDETTLNSIIKASKDTDIEVPVLLAAWLGLRLSEICGLKWSKIHDGYIIIDNAIVVSNGKANEGAPKTASSVRKVLLPKYIKDILNKSPQKNRLCYNYALLHYRQKIS